MPSEVTESFKTVSDDVADNSVQKLRSLEMVKTGWLPKLMGALLLVLLAVSVFLAMFVPWRQSVVGSGEIIVFSPMERPHTIEAEIPGRLLNWFVRDGQIVSKGQVIAELGEMDSHFLNVNQGKTLLLQKQALIDKRESARERCQSLREQLVDLNSSRQAALPAAQQRVGQANDRLDAAQQSVEAAQQNVKTTQWQLDRINTLYEKGLRSQRDQQVASLDTIRAATELQRAKSAYDVVKRDTSIAGLDSLRVSADTHGGISAIKASLADANQVISSTSAELAKLEVDIQNLDLRVKQRAVKAPCAGRVVRLNRVGAGETVSAGTVLATIAPVTEDRAAALMIRDYDAPLVTVDAPVRVTISGWPSLQFSGWPSVAVGTFAGRVSVIDAVDDGQHYYRVIVVPDYKAIADKQEVSWPDPQYLRPGAKASGWVLLSDVPLWYELWRQFNGFQPTLPSNPAKSEAKN